jgi:3-keto-5-aminohexanoate cleavage enzyme
MKKKIIISLAPVKSGDPIYKDILAEDVDKSVQVGASMCHLHSRRNNGDLSADTSFFVDCFDEILRRTDVVVQASTGGISEMTIEERCRPLTYHRVETASLNGGSTNLGECIYKNSFDDIRYCAEAVYTRGIYPEVEVFDIGMIQAVEKLSQEEKTRFKKPMLYNLVFGHKGGMQATIESLYAFRSFVPKEALWGVTHYGRQDWRFMTTALAMGASLVRIGFEDSNYLVENKQASYNYELVKKLVDIIQLLDLDVATPDEAREIMGIKKNRQ